MPEDWKDFVKEEKSSLIGGCAGLIAGLVIVAAIIFIEPLIICKAWSLFAVAMFGLPQLEYWTAFWVNLAVGCLFGGASFTGGTKNNV